ncbi:uncharacterized protein LOC21388891 [Morus notabilis]|uniref:uncharacterized protein LOC21388891 n=1 Tax=Morus notabilis TaxID=981085 RepID=UPI000CED5E62|nr:uncharacterized protein LOC21388891 [Morus notabilis]
MGEVLFELEQVLRSKQHKLTLEESNALLNCKSKAMKEYTVGALFGAGVAWIATPKLSLFGRIGISAGASAVVGLWRLGSSLDSCLDHILSLEGSQMQTELAYIMAKKYRNDPLHMQRISKLFYSESVFDDTTSDQPKTRWRYRNFFSDNVHHGQSTNESDSNGDFQGDSDSGSRVDYNSNNQRGSNGARPNAHLDSESKQAPMRSVIDAMDPLDCVFGYPAMEEIHPPNPSTTSPRTHTRNHKRAHRRRRMRHQDVLLNSHHA